MAQNYRSKKEEEEGTIIPQNKFEILKSRVMQCGVEEKMIRRQETVVVECFKYRKKGHKCRECPLWRKAKKEKRSRRVREERAAHVAMPQKVQQEERKLRRVEESEVAHMAKPREAQQE